MTLAPILPVGPESLERAVLLLRAGEVCAFPTETVYGLGADATNEQAVLRIYEQKGRPRHNPLIVHVPDIASAKQIAASWSPQAEKLAQRFWPGPLSIVMPRGALIPSVVSAGLDSVAIRVPAHPVALALLVFNTFPIVLGMLSWMTGGERPGKRTWIAMPIALLVIALAYELFSAQPLVRGRRGLVPIGARWLLAALALGALAITNSWDLPTYTLLIAGALFGRAWLGRALPSEDRLLSDLAEVPTPDSARKPVEGARPKGLSVNPSRGICTQASRLLMGGFGVSVDESAMPGVQTGTGWAWAVALRLSKNKVSKTLATACSSR